MKKLDPRTKIMFVVCFSTAAMLTDKIFWLAGLLAAMIVFLAIGGITPLEQLKKAKTILGMILFLFILQTIFGQWETGALLSVRLLILTVSALVLLTSPPRDYLLAMVQCHLPYELAFMVILAFRFFPILREEALDVMYAIQLRGADLKKNSLKNKFRLYKYMAIPILSGALIRARDVSTAMELRAFRSQKKRTYLRRLKLKKRDVLLLVLMPVLAAGFIFSAQFDWAAAGIFGQSPSAYAVVVSQKENDTLSFAWTPLENDAEDALLRVRINNDEVQMIQAEIENITVGSQNMKRCFAEVSGLSANDAITYQIGSSDRMSRKEKLHFGVEDQFSFMVIGDVQYQLRDRDYPVWSDRLTDFYAQNQDIDLALFVGDLVDKSSDLSDWCAFLDAASPLTSKVPSMFTPGNHETSIKPTIYLQEFSLPEGCSACTEECYAFDCGGCHFISLNSCLFMPERQKTEGWESMMTEVDRWLRTDLAAHQDETIIVWMHHPMYGLSEDNDFYSEMRSRWEPILIEGGVQLVFCGHQHCYMRTEPINGITYVMSNSGEKISKYVSEKDSLPGYVSVFEKDTPVLIRVDVRTGQLTITAVNDTGETIDNFTINRGL